MIESDLLTLNQLVLGSSPSGFMNDAPGCFSRAFSFLPLDSLTLYPSVLGSTPSGVTG